MLDRLIMNRLNSKGRKNYMIGLLIMVVLIFIGAFTTGVDLGSDSGYVSLLVIAVVGTLAWGGICIKLWPKSVSNCPWCLDKMDTPIESLYTCTSCNQKFRLGVNAKITKEDATE